MRRAKGFTLIELLVVIAIIGILAAMLFPVFARARESARKTQCLANIKNIATAYNMYLVDWDRTPPAETNMNVINYFTGNQGDGPLPGGSAEGYTGDWCATEANPYLRVPVILEEYVKNRDVWRCPSARLVGGATFMISASDWFNYFKVNEGAWGEAGGWVANVCVTTWPNGWGGTITDTIAQGVYAVPTNDYNQQPELNAFTQSVATLGLRGVNPSHIQDTAAYMVCADGGAQVKTLTLGTTMTPDLCGLACGGVCCGADWENFSDSCARAHAPNDGSFILDASKRKDVSRHLGGVNIGFMDGHAKWYATDAVLAAYKDEKIDGMEYWGPTPETLQYTDCWLDPNTTPSLLK